MVGGPRVQNQSANVIKIRKSSGDPFIFLPFWIRLDSSCKSSLFDSLAVKFLPLILICLILSNRYLDLVAIFLFQSSFCEENGSSKFGVRFDRSIPEGNDLGGLCEEDHGFFCAASSLRLDSSGGDDVDKLIINEIFEVALNEIKSSPLILFVKDIEKSIAGNTDIYTALKSKLENLPTNIVVIGSHTQMDNHKEKSHPGSLLFPKFGSNQTVLLDLAFPDNLVDFMKGVKKQLKP
ncbi:uncharacterized protein LOC120122730 [Hibiscus syriacus]|uniref:uncharacterized protein LOC120122730 n=1 Tax=Hibiscus syriacus TaxID=106335 RepID=UPI0019206F2C|nr:uncharacterized protein LOC120122730 [Hibiscus syriacus]